MPTNINNNNAPLAPLTNAQIAQVEQFIKAARDSGINPAEALARHSNREALEPLLQQALESNQRIRDLVFNQKMIIHVHSGGTAGHGYLGIPDKDGSNTIKWWGYYPEKDGQPIWSGQVREENEPRRGFLKNNYPFVEKEVRITQEGWRQAWKYIDKVYETPGIYAEVGANSNCIYFINDTLKQSGIPDGIINIFTPEQLEQVTKPIKDHIVHNFMEDPAIRERSLYNQVLLSMGSDMAPTGAIFALRQAYLEKHADKLKAIAKEKEKQRESDIYRTAINLLFQNPVLSKPADSSAEAATKRIQSVVSQLAPRPLQPSSTANNAQAAQVPLEDLKVNSIAQSTPATTSPTWAQNKPDSLASKIRNANSNITQPAAPASSAPASAAKKEEKKSAPAPSVTPLPPAPAPSQLNQNNHSVAPAPKSYTPTYSAPAKPAPLPPMNTIRSSPPPTPAPRTNVPLPPMNTIKTTPAPTPAPAIPQKMTIQAPKATPLPSALQHKAPAAPKSTTAPRSAPTPRATPAPRTNPAPRAAAPKSSPAPKAAPARTTPAARPGKR